VPRLMKKPHPDPHANVALDAELFRAVDATGVGETLRVWESQQTAVIVGSLGSISRDIHKDACLADGVPIIRRLSGGGAVVVARGCLNYSLVLSLDARPELSHVTQSYQLILGRIVDALKVPGLSIQGLSDLAIERRKVSGSAQRRGRRALLHHGTFLYAFDIHSLERYLKEPERQPAYRAGRRHAAFVANAPLDPQAIAAALIRAWVGEPEHPRPECEAADHLHLVLRSGSQLGEPSPC
jgi:lipoate-protein ligase A